MNKIQIINFVVGQTHSPIPLTIKLFSQVRH